METENAAEFSEYDALLFVVERLTAAGWKINGVAARSEEYDDFDDDVAACKEAQDVEEGEMYFERVVGEKKHGAKLFFCFNGQTGENAVEIIYDYHMGAFGDCIEEASEALDARFAKT